MWYSWSLQWTWKRCNVLMNKELLKLIEIPLAQPSIVLPLPCHVMYMSLCWRGFRKRTQFRWHESEINSDLIFHSHILCSKAVLGKYTLCYKYFRTVCPHWHFHFLKWNPHWPTERKKLALLTSFISTNIHMVRTSSDESPTVVKHQLSFVWPVPKKGLWKQTAGVWII